MIISIQYLRAIAAAMVTIYHAGRAAGFSGQLLDLLARGAAGVDIFFVISGFIMWQSTAGVPTTASAFLRKRITRIAPLYWLVTLIMCAMPFVSGTIAGGLALDTKHTLASLAFIPWHSARDDPGIFFPVYPPGWTLNFEMFFYLVFAACLCIDDARLRLTAAVATFGMIVLLGLAAPPQSAAAWSMSPIILEFAAGLCIGAWAKTHRRLPAVVAVAMVVIGFTALATTESSLGQGQARFFHWGIPAAFIVVGAIDLGRRRSFPEWPVLLLLGDASYSLYLTNVFVIGASQILYNHLHLRTSEFGPLIFLVAVTGVSHLVGVLTHRYVESPLLIGARKLWPSSKSRSAAPTAI